MRKSTLFISAVLTTFMLAILAGLVSTYRNTLDMALSDGQDPTAVAVDMAVPTQVAALLTPEEAAALAAQVIGRTDLYSVETALLNNVNTYLVTFTSGDLVYVSLDGQILSIGKVPVTVASAPPAPASNNEKHKRPRIPPSGGGGGEGEGEGGEEH